MMWRILLILLFFIQPVAAKKGGGIRDPFNAKNQQEQVEDRIVQSEELPKSAEATRHCVAESSLIAQRLSFHQLFIIGAIQQTSGGKVLFRDPQNNIFIASEGEFIGTEQMKLHKVGGKSIEFVGWNADCSLGQSLLIDF